MMVSGALANKAIQEVEIFAAWLEELLLRTRFGAVPDWPSRLIQPYDGRTSLADHLLDAGVSGHALGVEVVFLGGLQAAVAE